MGRPPPFPSSRFAIGLLCVVPHPATRTHHQPTHSESKEAPPSHATFSRPLAFVCSEKSQQLVLLLALTLGWTLSALACCAEHASTRCPGFVRRRTDAQTTLAPSSSVSSGQQQPSTRLARPRTGSLNSQETHTREGWPYRRIGRAQQRPQLPYPTSQQPLRSGLSDRHNQRHSLLHCGRSGWTNREERDGTSCLKRCWRIGGNTGV